MTAALPEVAHTRESALQFFQYYTSKKDTEHKQKIVIDLSAGSGYIAHLFEDAGYQVQLYDLFPQQNKFSNSLCKFIDLQKSFPIEDRTADLVLCSETIEHLPNQHHLFVEVSRILKSGGIFILTTPNSSSLRSRFSQFMMESEHYATPAPNELNAFVSWDGKSEGYFSKLFISGVLRLRTLAALNHLKLKIIHPSKYSSTSVWMLWVYPILFFLNRKAYRKQAQSDPKNKDTYQSIFKINTSMDVLLSKHLIMEFSKREVSGT
ncbi:MAG: class I SAM-dependent methyltransferase [Bacteroidia bacterium]|nr:class I SAM-dependent methyltransferase [Bacteroidia bacterium]